MSEASKMSDQKTSMATRNATSSPALECGATPLERLDGQMILPCGPAPAPAKVSVRAGRGAASQISVTYGLHGSGSSASAALTQSLASRLRVKTDWLGSTLYRLTWKERVTPSGRRIPALRGTVRRCSANGFGSWPRPKVSTGEYQYANGDHSKKVLNLEGVAKLATWNRPQATDTHGGQAKSALNRAENHHGRRNNDLALLTDSGATPNGSGAEMTSGARLNPAHSRWLMALPIEWESFADTVTRSVRSKRSASSKRISQSRQPKEGTVKPK
jgi:hypothetical protein